MNNIDELANTGASAIQSAFERYHHQFKEITFRAKARFEGRDWHGMQGDMFERLDLYTDIIIETVAEIRHSLGKEVDSKQIWSRMKELYSEQVAAREDVELAETFFNSVTRRIFNTVGVNPEIEYVSTDFEDLRPASCNSIYKNYLPQKNTQTLLMEILRDYPFSAPYRDLDRDARLAAAEIDVALQEASSHETLRGVQMLKSAFYRLKSVYLIGKMLVGSRTLPLVLCLRHPEDGIHIDAVLLTEDEVSILFSFTRSYFHVEAKRPYELVDFLKSIMPLKRLAELYISIGYNKHGKTELYRDLLRHMSCTNDKFVSARGEKGMVMLVFTMPSYDIVFKVIRDRFAEPKTTTRQDVINCYQLVFHRDRAGRLVDAQEFEHLRFERGCFSEELLHELLEGAPSSVTVDGNWVDIKHLYTERRLTPLDIFLREANEKDALEAAIDYGDAIKDLAATNIFPGDILLKNFGVTRHGRVVFYDYDELCLLTSCHFRRIPQARDFAEEFQPEPWFYIGKNDIFPEEFLTFLGMRSSYREEVIKIHGDLFDVEFWKDMQKRHQTGELVDIFPYPQRKRLDHDERSMD